MPGLERRARWLWIAVAVSLALPATALAARRNGRRGGGLSPHPMRSFARQVAVSMRNLGTGTVILPEHAVQGVNYSCWLNAAIAATAGVGKGDGAGHGRLGARILENLIEPLSNGKYRVRLYLGKRKRGRDGVRVRTPIFEDVSPEFPVRDGKRVYNALVTASGPAFAVALIEKAYAQHLGSYDGRPLISRSLAGSALPALKAFTPGGRMRTLLVPLAGARRLLRALGQASEELRPATALLTVGLTPRSRRVMRQYDLETFHHVAVVGVDVHAGTVDLLDPHGRTLKGMPIRDFQAAFTTLNIGPSLSL